MNTSATFYSPSLDMDQAFDQKPAKKSPMSLSSFVHNPRKFLAAIMGVALVSVLGIGLVAGMQSLNQSTEDRSQAAGEGSVYYGDPGAPVSEISFTNSDTQTVGFNIDAGRSLIGYSLCLAYDANQIGLSFSPNPTYSVTEGSLGSGSNAVKAYFVYIDGTGTGQNGSGRFGTLSITKLPGFTGATEIALSGYCLGGNQAVVSDGQQLGLSEGRLAVKSQTAPTNTPMPGGPTPTPTPTVPTTCTSGTWRYKCTYPNQMMYMIEESECVSGQWQEGQSFMCGSGNICQLNASWVLTSRLTPQASTSLYCGSGGPTATTTPQNSSVDIKVFDLYSILAQDGSNDTAIVVGIENLDNVATQNPITVKLFRNSVEVAESPQIINQSFPPNSGFETSFIESGVASGEYTYRATVSMQGDMVSSNNELTKVIVLEGSAASTPTPTRTPTPTPAGAAPTATPTSAGSSQCKAVNLRLMGEVYKMTDSGRVKVTNASDIVRLRSLMQGVSYDYTVSTYGYGSYNFGGIKYGLYLLEGKPMEGYITPAKTLTICTAGFCDADGTVCEWEIVYEKL